MKLDYSDKNPELGAYYADHVRSVAARHDDALNESGAAHAVVFSGRPKPSFLDDYMMPFRANPHFLAWVPLPAHPFSYLVYTPGSRPVLIYYQPRDYWHTVPDEPDGFWTSELDVRVVHDFHEIAMHLPFDRDKCVLIGETEDDRLAHDIERINPDTVLNVLHLARGRKTQYELACMRLASRRGASGHLAAEAAFRAGKSEFAIHQAYCRAASHTDSELPYGNIVALNEHGAVLHYTDLDRRPPSKPHSFLIDAGAQVHGYASDITRTYSGGDKRFDSLIALMETLQQTLVGRVQAGIDYRDLHLETHHLLAGVLNASEFVKGSEDELIASGVTSAFFPHGLGHLLGVQVHDVGGFMQDASGARIEPPDGHPHLRLTRALEEDMVLTIEPGLYAIDLLLDRLRDTHAEKLINWKSVDWLRPFGGIRIEDNVRVLAEGSENLTRDAFKDMRAAA